MKKVRLLLVAFALILIIGLQTGCGLNDGTVRTYPQGDPNIAMDKYNQLLVEWAFDKNYPNDIYADFPDFFGGAYIGAHGNLVIMLTHQDKQIEDYFDKLIGLDNVVFEKTTHSFETLVSESDAAAGRIAEVNSAYHGAVSSVGISIPDNAINVYINMNIVEEYDLDVKQLCNALTAYENICIVEVSGYDEPA